MAERDALVDSEAATSFRWLLDGLGYGRGLVLDEAWLDVRDRMRRQTKQNAMFLADWISDPWIAKGIETTFLPTAAPTWDPPDAIDAWPTFGVDASLEAVGFTAQRTRDDTLVARLASAACPSTPETDLAIAEFMASERQIARHGDERMVFGDQVRAWLLTAVGSLLRGVLFSSGVDPELLVEATVQRLVIPSRIRLPDTWVLANQFGDRHLELLLNLSMQPDGNIAPLDPADLRIGQGVPWQQAWAWLSQEVPAELARDAVRLAARLLRNDAVREGLSRNLGSGDPALRTTAVAVSRRWALTLKAMTWVEDALTARWKDVRPSDVVCFGFNATKPDWPRRLLAISHRSGDAKPQLRHMGVWRSSRCAIDATYLPSWETNTGMIWGLFGATPGVVRVATPGYGQSVWCRREAELAQHLLDTSDFLSSRVVVDVDLEELRALDAWDTHVRGAPRDGLSTIAPEFPSMLLEVWTPQPLPAWEAAVLRAGGALRAMSAFLHSPAAVNGIVNVLLADGGCPEFRGTSVAAR